MVRDSKIREHISAIKDKVAREYAPEKIILFGSCVRGTPGPDSDIDMLIIKTTGERPIDRRVRVARIASDSKRLVPFQPLVLTPAEIQDRMVKRDQFVKGVLKKGEVLYNAEG